MVKVDFFALLYVGIFLVVKW